MTAAWTLVTMAAALVIGVLSGMGMGSAGLFVLFLTSVAGMGQTEAQGLNLIFYLCSAGASLFLHAKKQAVPLRIIPYLALFAAAGVVPGVYLADHLDALLLRRLFGGMLVITGTQALLGERLFRRRRKETEEK
ncbi:MAG: sulfite exporter TauE/SafE family protein [Clostridia bacterium]|nr:sulfite exporter TauE/SafE family protein [Clostridia bacterium]